MKPSFQKEKRTGFPELKRQVDRAIGKNFRKSCDRRILLNALLLLSLFTVLIISMWIYASSSAPFISCAVLLGMLSLPLLLNIGHEAIHGNFTSSPITNRIGKFIFFMLGTSSYFWELRHIYSHHTCTNILEWDLDIEQSTVIRLSGAQECRAYHRYQYLYMPFAFMFYTLNWFFIRDLRDLFKSRFGTKIIIQHPLYQILFLFGAKAWHITFLILIPYYLSGNLTLSLAGFFAFHLSASLTTTLVLVSTHIGEDQEICQVQEDGQLPYSWIEHQIRSTGDFCTKSTIALHFFGGFNHHLAHHLFPNVPYLLYPRITPLIIDYCRLNNLPYHHYDNLYSCVKSHFIRLKKNSLPDETFFQL